MHLKKSGLEFVNSLEIADSLMSQEVFNQYFADFYKNSAKFFNKNRRQLLLEFVDFHLLGQDLSYYLLLISCYIRFFPLLTST